MIYLDQKCIPKNMSTLVPQTFQKLLDFLKTHLYQAYFLKTRAILHMDAR